MPIVSAFPGGGSSKTVVNVTQLAVNGGNTGIMYSLSDAKLNLSAATDGNGNVLFGGGYGSDYVKTVERYTTKGVRTMLDQLYTARGYMAAATDGVSM